MVFNLRASKNKIVAAAPAMITNKIKKSYKLVMA
jgi:hypothetical protein